MSDTPTPRTDAALHYLDDISFPVPCVSAVFARQLERELAAEREAREQAEAKLARVLEDRARFPDKPDGVGDMIAAHIGNLKNAARHHEGAWRRADTEKDYAETKLNIAREALERICDKAMDFLAEEIAREALDKIK